ncbi:hypothetical protein LXL04_028797 [Taraxacum kok-saghyz]
MEQQQGKLQNNWRFKDATSFFISNLPLDWETKEIRRELEPLGTLIDLFVVEWRDKYENRFGFARYNRVVDSNTLLDKLNKIRMGNKLIYGRLAKFDRRQKNNSIPGKRVYKSIDYPPQEVRNSEENKVRNNISYKEACQGIIPTAMYTPANNTTKIAEDTVNFNDMLTIRGVVDRTEELKAKLIGELIHFKAITHIVNVLIGEGIQESSIDYLGDLSCKFIIENPIFSII